MYIIITMSIIPDPLPSSISSSLNQLKLGNLPQLKMSKTAKTTILTQQIIEFIVNEVKVIPNFQTMSTDLHLMHHICNVIENLERKDLEPKLDKKALFLDIVGCLRNLVFYFLRVFFPFMAKVQE